MQIFKDLIVFAVTPLAGYLFCLRLTEFENNQSLCQCLYSIASLELVLIFLVQELVWNSNTLSVIDVTELMQVFEDLYQIPL